MSDRSPFEKPTEVKDIIELSQFSNISLRQFAAAELGEDVVSRSTTKEIMELLMNKSVAERWDHRRGKQVDRCHMCGWEGVYASVGTQWHITKDHKFYENPTVSSARPNFARANREDELVCVNCVRRLLEHHPDSGGKIGP